MKLPRFRLGTLVKLVVVVNLDAAMLWGSLQWKQFADFHARDVRVDRCPDAPVFRRCFRFEIVKIHVARTAVEPVMLISPSSAPATVCFITEYLAMIVRP